MNAEQVLIGLMHGIRRLPPEQFDEVINVAACEWWLNYVNTLPEDERAELESFDRVSVLFGNNFLEANDDEIRRVVREYSERPHETPESVLEERRRLLERKESIGD